MIGTKLTLNILKNNYKERKLKLPNYIKEEPRTKRDHPEEIKFRSATYPTTK